MRAGGAYLEAAGPLAHPTIQRMSIVEQVREPQARETAEERGKVAASEAAREEARQESFRRTLRNAHKTISFSETMRLAVDSFRSSKGRFALTALGMVIGSASVILVVTIGMTGKQYVLGLIEKIGTNEVELEYAGGGATGTESAIYNDYLTREDEKAVDEQVPSILYSSPILEMHDRISFGGGVVKDTLVLGVVPDYQKVRNLLVLNGRFMDEEDENAHIKCAIVTLPFARQMFGSADNAIGQNFQISGIPFTIIGTFKESVETFGQSEITDNTILIPYSVARYFTGTDNVKQIYFSLRSMEDVPDASKAIKAIVKARHKTNSVYNTTDLQALLTTAAEIANGLTAVLIAVAMVTLAVGGVGIMNIMLANVRAGESSPRSRALSRPPTRQKYEHRAFRERAAAPRRRKPESATAASPCRRPSRPLSLLCSGACPSHRPRKRLLRRRLLRHHPQSPAGRKETQSTSHPDSTAHPHPFRTVSARAAHPSPSTAKACAGSCSPSSPAPPCR